MKHNTVVTEEFRVPVWSVEKVRNYLRDQADIKELLPGITIFDITEECYIIFYYFVISMTGKRKTVRKTFGEIRKGIKEIVDGKDN